MPALSAEIRLANLRVFAEGGGGVFEENAACLQHVAVVADFQREVGVLLHE